MGEARRVATYAARSPPPRSGHLTARNPTSETDDDLGNRGGTPFGGDVTYTVLAVVFWLSVLSSGSDAGAARVPSSPRRLRSRWFSPSSSSSSECDQPRYTRAAREWPGRGQMRRVWVLIGGLAIAVAGSYAATLVATEGEPLLVVPLVGALVGLAIFTRPELGCTSYSLPRSCLSILRSVACRRLRRERTSSRTSQDSRTYVALQRLRSRRRHDLGELVDASCCWRQRSGTLRTSRVGPRAYILAFRIWGGHRCLPRGFMGRDRGTRGKRGGLSTPSCSASSPPTFVRERRQLVALLWIFCARGWSEGVSGHRQLRRGADAWSVLARGASRARGRHQPTTRRRRRGRRTPLAVCDTSARESQAAMPLNPLRRAAQPSATIQERERSSTSKEDDVLVRVTASSQNGPRVCTST